MMDVHLAEPSRRFWRVQLAVPHAVADTDHRAFDVLYLESKGFLDPKTCPSQQGIEDWILSLGLRDDRADLLGRESRSPLILDLGQIHEVMVPLHWIDLLPFIVDGGRHHHLHNLDVVTDRLRGKTWLVLLHFGGHLRNEVLHCEVVHRCKRHFPDLCVDVREIGRPRICGTRLDWPPLPCLHCFEPSLSLFLERSSEVRGFRFAEDLLGVCSELGDDLFQSSLLLEFVEAPRPVHRADADALIDAVRMSWNVQPKPGIECVSFPLDSAVLTRPARHVFPPSLVWYRSKNLSIAGGELQQIGWQFLGTKLSVDRQRLGSGKKDPHAGRGYQTRNVEALFQSLSLETTSVLPCQSYSVNAQSRI